MINHNRSADGLRGLAALNVVVSHFFFAFLPFLLQAFYPELHLGQTPPDSVWFRVAQLPFFAVFYNGQFAVLVFFVLSGYVLALPYFAHEPEKIRRRFWARYLRLNIPIAAVVALSWMLFTFHLYFNTPAAAAANSPWLNTVLPVAGTDFPAMVNNAMSGAIVYGTSVFDPPLWTINIEFVGSLYLLAYYALKPRARDALTLFLVSLLLWVRYPEASLFVIAMFCGSYLGKVKLPRKSLAVAVALGVYLGGFQYDNALYNFLPKISVWDRKTLYNTLGALLLVGAVVNGFGAGLFGSRLLQYFGRISYSIYLLHFLVLGSLGCKLYLILPPNPASLALIFVSYAVAAILLAHFFEKFVDRNAIAVSRKFSDFLFRKKPSVTSQPG